MTTTAPPRPATDAQVSADGPVQLLLPLKPPPGLCDCGCRLSVVNTDGVCDACNDEKARLRRVRGPLGTPHRVRLIGVCSRCGVEPHDLGDAYCAACRKAANAEYYQRRRKERNAPTKPCARCGQGQRVAYTSYCRDCSREYQAKRQQRRQAARGQGVGA